MMFSTRKRLNALDDEALDDRLSFWEPVRRTVPQVAKPLVTGVAVALFVSLLFSGVSALGFICLGTAVAAGATVALSTWLFASRETRLLTAEKCDRKAQAARDRAAQAAPMPFSDLGHAFRLGTSKAVAVKTLKLKSSKPRHGFFT